MKNVPEKMKALVCHGPKDYRLEMIDTPKPGARELLIKVTACGICAGDVKCESGAQMFWGDDPWVKTPVVPGHEFFGVVVAFGEGAEEHFDVQMGDRILAEQIVPCNKCRFCKSGKYWMCEVHNIYGFQHEVAEGGMSEYMLFKETSIVHKLPDALSVADAAVIEPMACSIHTVNRADVQFNDVVVLAGAGPLGLGMVQALKLKTPKKLIVIDTIDERLDLAKRYGADLVLNPLKEDVVAKVKALTDGYGCDVYIEATGVAPGVTQGLDMIRKLGRFVEFSVFGSETTVDWSIIGDRKELDIRGAHLGPYCYEVVIDLLERGLITSEGIVTHEFALDDWQAAFEVAHGAESVKVLLKP
ncbi:alcohol dehydrogenase catalytic domain-containing protein [Photobacterium nomapromontoriensis]|uniref:alcohol dehydrogenase catalytic domain-containing protein n=1 Tax=Photobacterium nomapromontoriensis TaxID=2910237 RepID=UPI003D1198BB